MYPHVDFIEIGQIGDIDNSRHSILDDFGWLCGYWWYSSDGDGRVVIFFSGMGCCEYGDDGPQKPTDINHCCTEYVWVSYNIPLTWIKAIKGDGFL